MLYLVATPIGNLQDITLRALELLKCCDYILCEDTRHSLKLLNHYDIHKPLKSCHEHNERERAEQVIADIKAGKQVVLISDAGTPGISDPGHQLVKACKEAGLEVQSIPGPCAPIVALTASGLPTDRFQFMGFLPKKASQIEAALQEAFTYPGTTIFFESPQRLLSTLDKIDSIAPNRPIAIARELTKAHEEHLTGTAKELAGRWKDEQPRGEVVLLIAGEEKSDEESWSQIDPVEHVHYLESTYGMPRNEAIKLAAKMRGISKNKVYNLFHKI